MAISGEEYRLLSRYFTDVALKYLQTGVYDTVTTLGGESLTPVQRRLLDAFRDNPGVADAAALKSVLKTGYTTSDLENTLETIRSERVGRAGDVTRAARAAAVPDPNVPPLGPLPANQEYRFDYSRNAWTVVENGTRFVTFVDQTGASAPAPEETAAPRTAAATPATGTTTSAEAAYAATEFGAGISPYAAAELGQMQAGVEGFARGTATTTPAGTPSNAVSEAAPVVETPPVPTDWETAAQEMYPEYYAIVKNNPEIAELLKKSLAQDWSEAKFAAELRGTNWYQTTTAAAREWDTASALDPASYQAKVDEAATAIQTEALNLGIRLSDATLQKLALDSQRLGWGAQTITNAIGMAATEGGSEGATQLREGYYGQSVRNLAKQYGVTLADQTFNSFINKIAVGEETLGSFQDYAMTIGKSLYPPLAEQFDAGRTFEDITASYKNIAADILERDPNSIDMAKPEWVQAITYVPDTKTGEQRLMNMGEWGDYLRKTESLGYQNTTEARSRAYEVGNKIANMFGRI